MIHVRTGSRLHFGLLALPSNVAAAWTNDDGEPTITRRVFGGVGLMVDAPGIDVSVDRAADWRAEGPLADRALRAARVYCESVGIDGAFQMRLTAAPPEHVGLGVGTQLSLAVAQAISFLTEQKHDALTLAGHVKRGLRSALGIHGFERGGLLVEGGKAAATTLAPLLARCDFPKDWHLLLITPRDLVGTHGRREINAFAALAEQPPDDATTDTLCRLVLLGLLPALAERDLPTFGEALYDFNRRSGALFKLAQGGVYAHPRVEQIVNTIRAFGVKGVGQSSWGPTLFAVARPEEIGPLRQWLSLKHGIATEEMVVGSGLNQGFNLQRNP